jgi:transposase-like protein
MKKKARPRRFSREFKVAAVERVLNGERHIAVARDLEIRAELLWRWKKTVVERGADHLHGVGRRRGQQLSQYKEASQEKRIAELERLIGRQQMEIRFLDRALRLVEEERQGKNDDGGPASSKQ